MMPRIELTPLEQVVSNRIRETLTGERTMEAVLDELAIVFRALGDDIEPTDSRDIIEYYPTMVNTITHIFVKADSEWDEEKFYNACGFDDTLIRIGY